jgi:hypothetical protein
MDSHSLTAGQQAAIQFMCQQMQNREKQILIPNFADNGESRKLILANLNQAKAKASKGFNLNKLNAGYNDLIKSLKIIAKEYLVSIQVLQTSKLQQERENIQLELEVNQNLFKTVYKITCLLNLAGTLANTTEYGHTYASIVVFQKKFAENCPEVVAELAQITRTISIFDWQFANSKKLTDVNSSQPKDEFLDLKIILQPQETDNAMNKTEKLKLQ